MRIRLLPILLAGLAVLSGCGDEPEPVTSITGLEGPPSFKRAREDMPSRSGMTLTARGACELRFRVEFTGESPALGTPISVGRGETVRIWWEHAVRDETVDSTLPDAMKAEGRTVVRVPTFRMGLENLRNALRSRTIWVRPDRVQETSMDLFISAEPQTIEFGADVELATVVVADVDTTKVSLQPREGRHRLRLDPAKPGEDERIHVMRLFLEVLPAGN